MNHNNAIMITLSKGERDRIIKRCNHRLDGRVFDISERLECLGGFGTSDHMLIGNNNLVILFDCIPVNKIYDLITELPLFITKRISAMCLVGTVV